MSVGQAPAGRVPIGLACTKTLTTENPSPPEGFEEVDAPSQSDDDAITLSPGEALNGVILSVDEERGDYGNHLYTVKDEDRGKVPWFGNNQVDRRYNAGRFEPGDTVWICKTPEEESFEDDDGEKQTYNVFNVAVRGEN